MQPTVIASRCGSYKSLFDRRTGLLARYMDQCHLPEPELLEMELVGPEGELFDLALLREVLDQAGLCRQVLLVGRSSAHPALPSILRLIRDHGVVPSVALARSDEPTREALQAIVRFAGAVTVDPHLATADTGLLPALHEADIRITAHLVLTDANRSQAVKALTTSSFGHYIDRVLLAGRNRTGSGARAARLATARGIRQCRGLVQKRRTFRVGLDARTASLLASRERKRQALLPRCEAGRTGLFIKHDGGVSPCSLVADRHLGSVRHQSLRRMWQGPRLAEFRRHQGLAAPCRRIAVPCGRDLEGLAPLEAIPNRRQQLDLRFGLATSSLCDRTVVALSPNDIIQVLGAVHEWSAMRFFLDSPEEPPTHAPASWSSLEYFMNIPPLWGQDLARLHEQLVAGTFERQELAQPR